MLVGFGVLSSALIILATTTPIPLSWLMGCLGALSVVALAVRRQVPGGSGTWIALALTSPILVIAAGRQPELWDDFWNWLPSAAYLYWHNALPARDLAPSLAIFPGYPQGMPLTIAAASFINGHFLESAGAVINVALLAGSSALLAEAVRATLVRNGSTSAAESPLVLVAGAVAITILLNPGLNGSVVLSSYAETGTMVAVGALGLFGVAILRQLSSEPSADLEGLSLEGLSWRFGFVGAMLINIKQANPVLLALVMAGFILIALREPAFRTQRALLQLPRMLGPGVVIFAVWRWYISQRLPNSEQAFRPLDAWHFDAVPDMLSSTGLYIAQAPLFHCLMWTVTVFGLVCFFQSPRRSNEARWLAIVCGTVWLGYNCFLLIIYLGVVSVSDAHGAADYWRYTPHVSLLGVYVPVMLLALARWPSWIKLQSPMIRIAAVVAALCTLPIRSDLNASPDGVWHRYIRDTAADIRSIMPAGSKVMILSFDNSFLFGPAVRYHLWQLDSAPAPQFPATIRWDERDLEKVAGLAARGEADYLIVEGVLGGMDEAAETLGLPRLKHEVVLFAWRNGAWQREKAWQAPLLVRMIGASS